MRDARVARNGGQRGAQIVGDGPQQIGPQGLPAWACSLHPVLLLAQQLLLQHQAALVHDGQHQVFL